MAILSAAGERFEYENIQSQTKKKKEDVEDEERRNFFDINIT